LQGFNEEINNIKKYKEWVEIHVFEKFFTLNGVSKEIFVLSKTTYLADPVKKAEYLETIS
jgi:hypothetical protein